MWATIARALRDPEPAAALVNTVRKRRNQRNRAARHVMWATTALEVPRESRALRADMAINLHGHHRANARPVRLATIAEAEPPESRAWLESTAMPLIGQVLINVNRAK